MDEFVSHRQSVINQGKVPKKFGTNFFGATVFVNPGFLESNIYGKYDCARENFSI